MATVTMAKPASTRTGAEWHDMHGNKSWHWLQWARFCSPKGWGRATSACLKLGQVQHFGVFHNPVMASKGSQATPSASVWTWRA
jgi:hypothetical protein